MGRLVPITLGAHEYTLFYSASALRIATATLRGMGKLEPNQNHGDAADMVRRGDLEAVNVFLQTGLQHLTEMKSVTAEKVDRWIDEACRADSIDKIVEAILDALKAGNYIKVAAFKSPGPDTEETDRPTMAPIRDPSG